MSGYYGQFESNDAASVNGVDFRSAKDRAGGKSGALQLALVSKVITTPNKEHQAGTIQFRLLDPITGQPSDTPLSMLSYARPLNTLFVSIPTLNEYVLIVRGPAAASTRPDQDEKEVLQYFYMTPLSIRGDINHNASSNVWNKKFITVQATKGDAAEYEANTDTPPPEDEENRNILGNDFRPNAILNDDNNEETLVMSPNMHEGDVMLSGRFGQTIRLSATLSEGANETWRGVPDLESDPPYQKPITIIRNGLPEDTSDRYVDNLITDPTAIYLTNGQYIPELKELKPFPLNEKGEPRSSAMDMGELFEHGTLGTDISQCIIRADRVMTISRGEIYQWSEKGISLASKGSITIDAGPQCIIESDIIYLGSGVGDNSIDQAVEPAVRGEKLRDILLEIIDAFDASTVLVGGITGVLVPPAGLAKMEGEIIDAENNGLLSKKVFLE